MDQAQGRLAVQVRAMCIRESTLRRRHVWRVEEGIYLKNSILAVCEEERLGVSRQHVHGRKFGDA